MKCGRAGWAGHVATMGRKEVMQNFGEKISWKTSIKKTEKEIGVHH
jgi:hypothetical protein